MSKTSVSLSMEITEHVRLTALAKEHGESLSAMLCRFIEAGERIERGLFSPTELSSDHAGEITPSGDKQGPSPVADDAKRQERVASSDSSPAAQVEIESSQEDVLDEGRSEETWPTHDQLERMTFVEKVFNCVSATPRTAREISEHTSLLESAVRSELDDFLEQGEILGGTRGGEWHYWLAEHKEA